MKMNTVIMFVLVVLSGSAILAQGDWKREKHLLQQSSELLISGAEYKKHGDALFAHAGPLQFSCPQTIVVGVITPPAGWTDYSRRVVPFENLTIALTAQGSNISCNYDGGRYALDRSVPGRVCTREGPTSPHLSCRTVPTKK